jgi:hypothetical protein
MFAFAVAVHFIFWSVSASDYIASNGKMINDELERTWKEAFMA